LLQLPPFGIRADQVERCLKESLRKLELTYVDLYLIHVPFGLTYIDDNNPFPSKDDGTIDMDVDTDLVAVWKVRILHKKIYKLTISLVF